jgi:alkylated DNA nucleotide flippase Atl1
MLIAIKHKETEGMPQMVFEAETWPEMLAQIRQFLDGQEGSGAPVEPVPITPRDAGRVQRKITNDDYRRAIDAIPAGKVAPYSVISEVVRGDNHGSQKVAGLAANDYRLKAAHRVVKIDGSIAAGFMFSDGSMGGRDKAHELLEAEGVEFDVHGRVRPEFVLGADELRRHYEAEEG